MLSPDEAVCHPVTLPDGMLDSKMSGLETLF